MVSAKLSQAASFGPLHVAEAVAALKGPVQVATRLVSDTVPDGGVEL